MDILPPSCSRRRGSSTCAVIPVKAGVQYMRRHPRESGDPGFENMIQLDARFREHDKL